PPSARAERGPGRDGGPGLNAGGRRAGTGEGPGLRGGRKPPSTISGHRGARGRRRGLRLSSVPGRRLVPPLRTGRRAPPGPRSVGGREDAGGGGDEIGRAAW